MNDYNVMGKYDLRDFPDYKAKQEAQIEMRKSWNFKNFMKNDPKALAEMKVNNPKRFSQLFKNQYGKAPIL